MSKNNENLYDNNLFNNPMVRAAKASMTPEQIAEYQRIGEEMYSTVDFETSTVLDNGEPLAEGVAYVVEALKSGIHPDYLEEDDVKIMEEVYGKNWKNKYME